MNPSFINQLLELLPLIIGMRIILLIVTVYLILSIWYNTRKTQKNTDRILGLLETYLNIVLKAENKEELIYGHKPETLYDSILEKRFSK